MRCRRALRGHRQAPAVGDRARVTRGVVDDPEAPGAVPLAPSKVDRAVAPLRPVPGPGRCRPAVGSRSVGRNVPLTIGPGTVWRRVVERHVGVAHRVLSPPASLSRIRFLVGVGPDSRTSRSRGAWCVSPLRVAVTLVTCPASPDTKMFDGTESPPRARNRDRPGLQEGVAGDHGGVVDPLADRAGAGQEPGRAAVGGPDQVGALGQRGGGQRGRRRRSARRAQPRSGRRRELHRSAVTGVPPARPWP